MKLGYLAPAIRDLTAYVLGDGNLAAPILQPEGQWDDYLPSFESQVENGYDPLDCTSESYTTCQEILERRLFGTHPEYAERWLAQISGTERRRGNDLHTVAEFGRKVGLIPETEWPSAGIEQEHFYDQPPARLYGLANKDHNTYERLHDYVPNTKEAIIEALKSSPLSFSVYAWDQPVDGVYHEPQGAHDTHATVIYGHTPEGAKVFDSGDPFLKVVAWDAIDGEVKRYVIVRKADLPELNRLERILLYCLQLLGLYKQIDALKPAQSTNSAPTAPTTPEPAPQPTKTAAERLYDISYAAIGTDVSPLDAADDEVGCAESLSRLLQKLYPDFPTYLSTTKLNAAIASDKRFKQIESPSVGCISIFPTSGTKIGHCGVVGKHDVMSNTSSGSKKGQWDANYSRSGWETAASVRGLPVYYYLPL